MKQECAVAFGLQSFGDCVERLLLFPQYPHYAMSSWETVVAKVYREAALIAPRIRIESVQPYYADADYIAALVASALGQMPPEDLRRIDGNPAFELYDFTHTDDLRMLLQIENFVAVNNAMAVDLTGNVSSETQGANLFSGPGGQNAFAVGASCAAGGSVIVLPSSSLVAGERKTRIVAGHPPGTVQTVHRGYVDFVVTEQGIARLRGKTIRQRVDELLSIAHPDFKAELRAEATRLYGV